MTTNGRIVAGLLVATGLLAASCRDELPTAPSDLTIGITIYEDVAFAGESAHLTSDVRNLAEFQGPCEHEGGGAGDLSSYYYDWNNCISSIRVAPGWRATVYTSDSFEGIPAEVTSDVHDLNLLSTPGVGSCPGGGMNDCITSIRVSRR